MIVQSNKNIYSVCEINKIIKEVLEIPIFHNIYIQGEISNWKGKNASGHYYFSLKDDSSVLKCVIFKFVALNLNLLNIKDGVKVIVKGDINSYYQAGQYQLVVNKIDICGDGDLFLKKQELYKKLDDEGIFKKYKKELPKFPKNIGVIVGENSAAQKDIEYNISKRRPISNIHFYFSLVQGQYSVDKLINSCLQADKDDNDLLIIARGGGSNEDLNAFDDEKLIRTIFNLKTPVITAIGHEINKTLCDLVSDKYASTPTEAACLSVPNKEEVISDLDNLDSNLDYVFKNYLSIIENKFNIIENNSVLKGIEHIYDSKFNELNVIDLNLKNLIEKYILDISHTLNYKEQQLDLLNPKYILNKGYVIIKDISGKILYKDRDIKENNEAIIITKDKEIEVVIRRKSNGK